MIDLDLIKPTIHFGVRDEDPRARDLNVSGDVLESLTGYVEVYQRTDCGLWFAYQYGDGGSARSQGYATAEEAVDRIHEDVRFSVRFWTEKILWALAGDVTEDGRPVMRVGGRHYVLSPDLGRTEPGMRGFGGRLFRFRLITAPDESRPVVESRNVWSQGVIPTELRDLLPDNATMEQPTEQYRPVFS
jgi:hypothetical protein